MNADVMSAIESIQRETSVDAIRDTLQKAIALHGFDKFIFSGLPDSDVDVRPFVLLSGWDNEWFERYASRGYVHHDPVARHCFTTSRPFDWSDAPYDRQADGLARQIMDEARDFGMKQGLCVPVHMEGGLQGVVSFVGETSHLDEKARLELHMLALYTHARLRFLNSAADAASGRGVITAREAEILKWVSTGRTADQIGRVTGLTARTVNQHCENAQKRLGTSNRLHTVVEAIRQNLIAL